MGINLYNVLIFCGISSKHCGNAEEREDHLVFSAVFGGIVANKANMSEGKEKLNT